MLSAVCQLPLYWAPGAGMWAAVRPHLLRSCGRPPSAVGGHVVEEAGRGIRVPQMGLAESLKSFPVSDVLTFPASELLLFRY